MIFSFCYYILPRVTVPSTRLQNLHPVRKEFRFVVVDEPGRGLPAVHHPGETMFAALRTARTLAGGQSGRPGLVIVRSVLLAHLESGRIVAPLDLGHFDQFGWTFDPGHVHDGGVLRAQTHPFIEAVLAQVRQRFSGLDHLRRILGMDRQSIATGSAPGHSGVPVIRILYDMSSDRIYHSITQILIDGIEKIFRYDILYDSERLSRKLSFYHYHFASGKTL